MINRVWRSALVALVIVVGRCAFAVDVEAQFNGLKIVVDSDTGTITKMKLAEVGTLLQSSPQRGGMIDLAYPIERFEPLRLAAKFSHGAKVQEEKDSITISWDKLGASRDFDLAGNVSASVTV